MIVTPLNLAIDLGKFNSVFCWFDPAKPRCGEVPDPVEFDWPPRRTRLTSHHWETPATTEAARRPSRTITAPTPFRTGAKARQGSRFPCEFPVRRAVPPGVEPSF